MSRYVYDSAWTEERRRLAGLEATFDAFTFAALDRVGVRPGWRCLDIGAGGGSVARNLAERDATVIATDLDTRHLEQLDEPRIEVRRHDLLADQLEPASFDLVHARMVLEHIPQRDAGLQRMYEAVKPGGWLLVEDIGVTKEALSGAVVVRPDSASEAFLACWQAIFSVMTSAGFDGMFAHRLPMTMMTLGLDDVECETRSKLIRGGSTAAAFPELSLVHLREAILATRFLNETQVETVLRAMRDPTAAWTMFPLTSAWGRKPR